MSHRHERIAAELRTVVAGIAREIPPDISTMASVTEVEVSPDSSYATLYISALSGAPAAIKYLAGKKRHISAALMRRVRISSMPEIRFRIDSLIAQGSRIDELLSMVDKHTKGNDGSVKPRKKNSKNN